MLMRPPFTPYSEFVREERHLAAILFHLLCDPKNCRLLLGMFAPSWDIATDRRDCAVFFDYAYLRDYWHRLGKRPGEANCTAANQRKYEYLSASLSALRVADTASFLYKISEFSTFNKSVSARPSENTLLSPARWQDKKIMDRDDICSSTKKAAVKLAWMFRIKPDLVIQPNPGQALTLELKVESKIANYMSAGSDKEPRLEINQLELQRQMMEMLFGTENTKFGLIMVKKALGHDAAFLSKTWKQIFEALGPQLNQPGFVATAIAQHYRAAGASPTD